MPTTELLLLLFTSSVLLALAPGPGNRFVVAFLPQFTDPGRGAVVPQVLLLGALFIVATILVFGAISMMAGTVGTRLRQSPIAQRALNWTAGSIVAGLAVRPAMSERWGSGEVPGRPQLTRRFARRQWDNNALLRYGRDVRFAAQGPVACGRRLNSMLIVPRGLLLISR